MSATVRQLESPPPGDRLLHSGFLRSSERAPNHPALEVDGKTWTYGELRDRAAAIASTLMQRMPRGDSPLTGIFAQRSSTAFAGILGALFAGCVYVPLNRTYPPGRTRWMLQNAKCTSLVVDSRSAEQLTAILDGVDFPLLIILPDRDDVADLRRRFSDHVILGSSDMEPAGSLSVQSRSPETLAYVLFTSGSTGTPKGVMVSHVNATHFVKVMAERYGIAESDRFSQMFATTFDLSVFDMFVAWERGACVFCPSEKILLNPDKFIRENELTVWFAVPSVGMFMKRLGVLKENRYQSLRWSLFCGEPLPVDLARSWAAAASGSVVENLYGPTELTVACSAYRWDAERSSSEAALGIVPIGYPSPGMEATVVDDDLREVQPGAVGELLMSGPQVTPGYWRNPEATERAYVRPLGREVFFYRTGDRVRKPVGDGPLTYVGRVDHQIKVFGHRVELGEVESKLREEHSVHAAVAIGWPTTATGPAGIVAFLVGTDIDPTAVRTNLKAKLQSFAVPHTIHVLPELPRNAHGKVDRQALLRQLER